MPDGTADELCQRGGLPDDDRLLVALGCALVRPDLGLLAEVVAAALRRGVEPVAIREVCLQGIAYAGFPRALVALEVAAGLLPAPGPRLEPPGEAKARGWEHFGAVYGDRRDRVYEHIASLDPLFAELTVSVAYGRILSRPGIDGRTRELIGIGALSVLDQTRQLVAHAFGARQFGARDEAILEAAATAASLFADVAERGHVDLLRRELGG